MLISYSIAGKSGGEKVWPFDSFRAFGKRKFGELIDQPIGYQLLWMVLVWRIMDDSLIWANFPAIYGS